MYHREALKDRRLHPEYGTNKPFNFHLPAVQTSLAAGASITVFLRQNYSYPIPSAESSDM